jgi:CBS domain-containing protein
MRKQAERCRRLMKRVPAKRSVSGLARSGSQEVAGADLVSRVFHPEEEAMKVRDCMSRDVEVISPDDTIEAAAKTMSVIDAGILPVAEDDRLVGMVTDRDLAIRAVGTGRPPSTTVREVMTHEVKYCFEDDEAEDALDNMAEQQLRRLPVLDQDKRLVGIVSISDLADEETAEAGKALSDIATPSAQHSQSV